MKKVLFLLVLVITLFACEKENDDQIKLQLNLKSCVLDNATGYAEIKIDKGEGFLFINSSDPDIAEILYEKDNENVFYIIGHNKGNATITVRVSNYGNVGTTKTIDVDVREAINYGSFSTSGVYLKKGETRKFGLPFTFDKNYSVVADNSAVIDNDGVASVSASVEMGNKFEVEAKAIGSTSFNICKGKVVIFSARVFVVEEYDLFIPESENSQLTFDLPFIAGVDGITIWRGSGHYAAKVADETVAVVKSVTPCNDHFDQQNNSAVVRITPLKSGKSKLLVTDEVTGQIADVTIIVN